MTKRAESQLRSRKYLSAMHTLDRVEACLASSASSASNTSLGARIARWLPSARASLRRDARRSASEWLEEAPHMALRVGRAAVCRFTILHLNGCADDSLEVWR